MKKLLKLISNLLSYKIISINDNYNLLKFSSESELQSFESHFTYSLTEHLRFKIIHGDGHQNGYLSFFESLGQVKFFMALDKTQGGQIIGAACAVLRNMSDKYGDLKKVWYFCDLKVIPQYQGQKIPFLFFLKVLRCSFLSSQWYGISMNAHLAKNKLASYLKRRGIKFDTRTLNFYFFSFEEIIQHKVDFESALKEYGFSSFYFKNNSHLKSFRIFDKKDPCVSWEWKTLHMQYGEGAHYGNGNLTEPVPGHVHMLATFKGSPFDSSLKALNMKPAATATVLSKGIVLPDILLTNEV